MIGAVFEVGIIGFGKMGRVHTKIWNEMSGVELVAIADTNSERREAAVAAHPTCQIFETGVSMVRSLPLDIVIVATQTPDHYTNAYAALEQGCHVICEKPFTMELWEADELLTLAKKKQLKLAVHHEHTFSESIRLGKEMIRNGKIGKLLFMEAWGKGRYAAYELMEDAIHGLQLMRYFADSEVKEVYSHVQVEGEVERREIDEEDARPVQEFYPEGRSSGIGAGDQIVGFYKFRNGIDGLLYLPTVETHSAEYLAIQLRGDRGRIQIHYSKYHSPEGKLLFKATPQDDFSSLSWQEIEVGGVKPEDVPSGRFAEVATRRFAEDFLSAFKENREPLVSGEDGAKALEMMFAIYASQVAWSSVKLPLDNRRHPLLSPL